MIGTGKRGRAIVASLAAIVALVSRTASAEPSESVNGAAVAGARSAEPSESANGTAVAGAASAEPSESVNGAAVAGARSAEPSESVNGEAVAGARSAEPSESANGAAVAGARSAEPSESANGEAVAGAAQTESPVYVNGARVDGAAPGEWTHDWDAATAAAKKDGKPVFADFTGSDWCPWCKILERQVFSRAEWGAWASNNVYLVRLDFPNDKSLVPEKYSDRNRELSRRYKVGGYPTCYLLDPATLEPIGRFGSSRDANPADFIAQISAAMPGAGKIPAAPSPSAAAKRPDDPGTARSTGDEPVFKIENGELLEARSNGAEVIVVPAEAKTVYVDRFRRVRRIVLSEGVEEIRRGSWGYDPGDPLESFSIPKSVRKIQPGAFYGYYRKLQSIEIAEGSPYAIREGCLVDTRDATMLYALPARERIVVPDGVKSIADEAFYGNGDAREIVLPEGIERIGQSAFSGCRALESVTIPATVLEIGDYAFSHCRRLSKVDVAPDNPKYAVTNDLLVDRQTSTIIRGIGDLGRVDVPAGTKSIAPAAFSGMKSLISATVPDSVKSIGDDAFAHCPELMELRLPKRVDACGGGIVQGCARLKSIEFPVGTKRFFGQDLNGCDSFRELVVPEGVVSLSGWRTLSSRELSRLSLPSSLRETSGVAFGSLPKLDSIDIHPDNPSFRSEDGVLFSKDMTRLIRCPQTKAGIYVVPATVTKIDGSAFSGCRNLHEIRIPEGVESIGPDAFKDCPAKTNRVATAAQVGVEVPEAGGRGGRKTPQEGGEEAAAGLPISKFPVEGLVAGFTFNDEDKADDFVKKGRKFELRRGPTSTPLDLARLVTNGTVRLNGIYAGEDSNLTNLEVPELRYDRFTVAMNFMPEPEKGQQGLPLVSFGGGWRWFHVFLRSDGTPVVSFSGLEREGGLSFSLPVTFRPGEWNWIAVAFDIAERRLSVVLNGRRCPDIALPQDFAFRFGRDDRENGRNVQFANANNGTVFKGEISGFLLFDRAFADEELGEIAVAPEPWTFARDEEGAALFWNGTISNGSVTLDARLSDGAVSVSFPDRMSVPGGVLDLRKPVLDPGGAEVALVGIGRDSGKPQVLYGGKRRDATDVRLPDTVRYLGHEAFKGFVSLERIDCPASVRRIGSAAFVDCRRLRTFRVGPAVEFFSDDRVFMGCEALEAIEVDPANSRYKSVDGALLTADGKRLVAFPTGRKGPFAVPAGVEEIPPHAFMGCFGLTKLTIPSSVRKIGGFAFVGCPLLKRIEFEDTSFKPDAGVFGTDPPETNLVAE